MPLKIVLIALFLSPILAIQNDIDTSTMASSDGLQACLNAPNCEVVLEANSTNWHPQFVKGMGPETLPGRGLEDRTTVKHTYVTVGQDMILYGSQNPCEAFKYAYYPCSQYGCDPNDPAVLKGNYAAGGQIQTATISITANGEYSSYNMRDDFIGALVGAASVGQQWTEGHYTTPYPCTKSSCEKHTVWYGTGVQYLGVAAYSSGGSMLGWMTVSNAGSDSTGPFDCATVLNDIGAVIGSVNGAGGLLGILTAVCQ